MAVEKKEYVKELVSALVLFALSLLMAWYFKWEARDVIWSIWLSSLLTGILTIIISFVRQGIDLGSKRELAVKWKSASFPIKFIITPIAIALSVVFLLFPFVFILFHFTAFHIGHAFFLNEFFPLFNKETTPFPPTWSELTTYYFPVLKNYLFFVPIALWMMRKSLMSANLSPVAPYKNVVLMHIFIIFFGFVFFATNLNGFMVYVIVYTIFLFPWGLLRKPKDSEKPKARKRAQTIDN